MAGFLVGAVALAFSGCSTPAPSPTGTRSLVASTDSPTDDVPTLPPGTPSPVEPVDGATEAVPTVQALVDALLTGRDLQVSTGLEWTPIGSSGAGSAPGAVTETNEAPTFGCAVGGAADQPAWQACTILGSTGSPPVTVTETLFAGESGEVEKAFDRLKADLLAKCLGPGPADTGWVTSGETFEVPDFGDDRFAFALQMVLDAPEPAQTAQWLTRFVLIRHGATLAVILVNQLLPGQATGLTADDVAGIAAAAEAKLP